MCPYKGKPDCFNCPLDDCKASGKEITHQEGIISQEIFEERNKCIIEDYLNGMPIPMLCERYNMKSSGIFYILQINNIPRLSTDRRHKRRKKNGDAEIKIS